MKRQTALLSLAGAIACPSILRAQTMAKVRVIAPTLDAAGPVFFAKDLGYFAGTGLDVDVTTPTNPGIMTSALTSGAVDVAYINVTQAEFAFHQGAPIRILAPLGIAITDHGPQSNFLLVPKDSPIKTAKDFEGKTLATAPLKGLGDFSFAGWAQARGADPSKFKWVEIPIGACPDALAQGRIDGAFVVEPFGTQALMHSNARVFCHPFTAIGTRFVISALFVTPVWADANRDVARRFAGAIRRAAAWGNKNPEQSGAILEKYAKIDPSTAAAMVRWHYAEDTVASELQPTVDFLFKNKLIDSPIVPSEMIYNLG